jgi:hypothetical protein
MSSTLWIGLMALAVSATAGTARVVVVERSGAGPETGIRAADSDRGRTSASGPVTLQAVTPSDWFIIPHFRVDTANPFGDTTLVNIRNEAPTTNLVQVQINNTAWTGMLPVRTLSRSLAPREVWSLNLRDEVGAIVADPDSYKRGWAYVLPEIGKPVSVELFQVNPDQDFATGGAGGAVREQDYCLRWKARFLVGGAFTGGTQLILLLDLALGTEVGTPPSAQVTLYDETGASTTSFDLYTDEYSLTLNMGNFTSQHGTMDIDLSNSIGGWVATVISAEGRYSVTAPGYCLEDLE